MIPSHQVSFCTPTSRALKSVNKTDTMTPNPTADNIYASKDVESYSTNPTADNTYVSKDVEFYSIKAAELQVPKLQGELEQLQARMQEEALLREEARRERDFAEAELREEVARLQEVAAKGEAEKEERPSFKKLKAIEKERRALLLRAELPFWRILFFWSGTCLKEISTDALVWFTLLIYIGIRTIAHSLEFAPEHVAYLETGNIAILGGFLSFFLVLFVNQANGRFLEMYNFSKECTQRIQDVAGLARFQLPEEIGLELVRHFNAAHIAGYVGLNGVGSGTPYSKAHFFDVYNQKHQLLTHEEMKLLGRNDMDCSGLTMKELVAWCINDVADARKLGHIDGGKENNFVDYVLSFRASMDNLYNYVDQPPHFFYVHFLILLSALYLPLFAVDVGYNTGWGVETYIGLDILNGVIVFLQCIFVVGLRALGNKMIDPYGDDLEDLSVISYIETTLKICDTIMTSKQPTRTWAAKVRKEGELYYSDDECDDDDGDDD